MTIREGKWKCPGCGNVNRGSVQQCKDCGKTRDPSVQFFLDDDAPEVTDEAQLARAQSGADWVCAYCDNASPQSSPTCTGCGAPKSEKTMKSGDVVPVAGAAPPPPAPPPASSSKGPVALAVIGLMLMLCCVCSWFTFRTQTETATVSQVAWERTIAVEDFQPVKESAWDQAPQGAYDVSYRREQRGTRQVQHGTHTEYEEKQVQVGTKHVVTGHKNLGNGHFEDVTKDEPVYKTKKVAKEVPTYVDEPVFAERYYYTIDKWVVVRTERATGGAGDAPTWPKVQLSGKERQGAKGESYRVTFSSKKNPKKVMQAPNEDLWERFKPGSSWKVEFDNAGTYTVLDPNGQPLALTAVDGK